MRRRTPRSKRTDTLFPYTTLFRSVDVVAGGPPQVLDHLAIGGLAQFDDRWHVARVAAHEYDVAGLDRDVRPCADGDADVGREQRRRVIDTVTHHRDALALSLQFPDLCHLVLGQYLGEDCVDVEFLRDRVCDRRGIPGQPAFGRATV